VKAKHIVVIMLFALTFVNYLDRVNISTVAPTMMRDLLIDPQAFGLVLAAFTCGYCIMQIPGGYLADRFGPKTLLVAAPLLWSVFTFSTGLATTVAMLIVARLLFGLCEGASNSALFRMIGDTFDSKERSRMAAIIVLGYALGPATAAPLVLWILTQSSWHYVFFWSALPGVVLALAMLFVLPGRTVVEPTHQIATVTEGGGGWREFLRNRTTWLLFAAYFAFNLGYWGFLGWMPSYLVMDRHVDLKTLGLAASIPYVFGALGLVVIGMLGSGPFFRRRGLLAAFCTTGVALSLLATFNASSIEATVAGLSAAAFFLYGTLGPYGSIVLDLAPSRLRGSFAGVINTGGQLGGIFAPVMVGYLVKSTGSFSAGFAFMDCGLIVSAICFASLTPALKRAHRFSTTLSVA
jgi:sugar phosphate permease